MIVPASAVQRRAFRLISRALIGELTELEVLLTH